MPRVHILDGKGLDGAVRQLQRQSVLWYESKEARDADIPIPWNGATTIYPQGNTLIRETFYQNKWYSSSDSGPVTPVITDHGQLKGLSDDDHPQYFDQQRGDSRYTRYRIQPALFVNIDSLNGYGFWLFDSQLYLTTGTFPAAPFTKDFAYELWQSEVPAGAKLIQVLRQGTSVWQRVYGTGSWGSWAAGGGGLDQGTADTRYVNVTGDTMTGDLTVPQLNATRLDVKDPAPSGGGGYASQRWYHDNNTDHMALSVSPIATPGLEFFDSRDGSNVLMRVARNEKVKFPANGHQHKYQASAGMAAYTFPAAVTWHQMTLTKIDDAGNLVNTSSISIPTAGYYSMQVNVGLNTNLTSMDSLIRITGGVDPATWSWASTRGISTVLYGLSPVYFAAACTVELWIAAGSSAQVLTTPSYFNVISLF